MMNNNSSTKRVKMSLFHRGRGHHIIRFSNELRNFDAQLFREKQNMSVYVAVNAYTQP